MNCSEKYGFVMYRHVVVIDLSKWRNESLMVPAFVDGVRRLMRQCAKLYPDTLERAYLVNANWLARMGWSVVKPWIHPNTQERINILGKDWVPKFMAETALSFDDIPSSHGGNASGFKDLPMMCPVPENSPSITSLAASLSHVQNNSL